MISTLNECQVEAEKKKKANFNIKYAFLENIRLLKKRNKRQIKKLSLMSYKRDKIEMLTPTSINLITLPVSEKGNVGDSAFRRNQHQYALSAFCLIKTIMS